MLKAKTKKQPNDKINPVVGIVGIKAIPIAEHIANSTHCITYNILLSFLLFMYGTIKDSPYMSIA